jgi:hypothetical protein
MGSHSRGGRARPRSCHCSCGQFPGIETSMSSWCELVYRSRHRCHNCRWGWSRSHSRCRPHDHDHHVVVVLAAAVAVVAVFVASLPSQSPQSSRRSRRGRVCCRVTIHRTAHLAGGHVGRALTAAPNITLLCRITINTRVGDASAEPSWPPPSLPSSWLSPRWLWRLGMGARGKGSDDGTSRGRATSPLREARQSPSSDDEKIEELLTEQLGDRWHQ